MEDVAAFLALSTADGVGRRATQARCGARHLQEIEGATQAEILAALTAGTSLERIGDESLTPDDSGFVHRNI
jgi:hypothetical protein